MSPAEVDRQALIAELRDIRRWEHRYECFDDPYCSVRGREIQAALSATTGERRAA
jgi:hypothetical protein